MTGIESHTAISTQPEKGRIKDSDKKEYEENNLT